MSTEIQPPPLTFLEVTELPVSTPESGESLPLFLELREEAGVGGGQHLSGTASEVKSLDLSKPRFPTCKTGKTETASAGCRRPAARETAEAGKVRTAAQGTR